MKGKTSHKTFVFKALYFTLTILLLSCNKKKVDWSPTFESQKTLPYGTFILYEELENIFPDENIIKIKKNVGEYLKEHYDNYNQNFIYIYPEIRFDSVQKSYLQEYAGNQNLIFLSFLNTDYFADSIETQRLNNNLFMDLRYISMDKEKVKLHLKDPLYLHKEYALTSQILSNYFVKIPDSAEILGTVEIEGREEPNFIKVPYKYGWYYLHAEPYIFTNIGLRRKNVSLYAQDVLGYLPSQTIVWNNWRIQKRQTIQQPSDGGPFEFMNFLWSQPPLRYGLLISLFAALLYIVFNSRRRQAVVGYQPPYKNDVLDYSQSLVQTYKRSKNFEYLANQKITYFLNLIKQKYFFTNVEYNDAFARQLHYKSQVPEKNCMVLVNYINEINQINFCSESQFKQLSSLLDDFYQKSQIYGRK